MAQHGIFGWWCLIFFSLLIFQYSAQPSDARKITTGFNQQKERKNHNDHMITDRKVHEYSQQEKVNQEFGPSMTTFFTMNDLRVGKKMSIFFPIKNSSQTPKLLPREEVDSIPFSLSQLPFLLQLFSYSIESPQAKAMEYTLTQCEFEAMEAETKFCSTSLESLVDLTKGVFGYGSKLKALTTNYPKQFSTPLQNYTISERPKEMRVSKILSCHTLPYPYLVFFCHSHESNSIAFEVLLVGENGDRVEAAAICHMDTSQWSKDHIAFTVLKTDPGTSPVCHFFPPDNLVWIPCDSV